MGVNMPDLGLDKPQTQLSVADQILVNSRRKGVSFCDTYWRSAVSDLALACVDSKTELEPVVEPDDCSVRPKVEPKRLSIPQENDAFIGGFSDLGGMSVSEARKYSRNVNLGFKRSGSKSG